MHDFISFLNLVKQDQIDSGIFRRQTAEFSGMDLKALQIQLISTPEVHSHTQKIHVYTLKRDISKCFIIVPIERVQQQ